MRRTIARLTAPLLIGAGLVLGSGTPAHACSCAQLRHDARVAMSDAVFVGTVGPLAQGLEYTRHVDVSSVYKGDVPRAVTVNTGQEGTNGVSSCDFELAAGRELLFFANGAGDAYSTGACNVPEPASDDVLRRVTAAIGGTPYGPLRADGPGSAPAAESDSAPAAESKPGATWMALLLGLGLAGGVVLVIARRRAR